MLESAGAFLRKLTQYGIVDVGKLHKRHRRCEPEHLLYEEYQHIREGEQHHIDAEAAKHISAHLAEVAVGNHMQCHIHQRIDEEYIDCTLHKLRAL